VSKKDLLTCEGIWCMYICMQGSHKVATAILVTITTNYQPIIICICSGLVVLNIVYLQSCVRLISCSDNTQCNLWLVSWRLEHDCMAAENSKDSKFSV